MTAAEDRRIKGAIAAAESRTTGHIVVRVISDKAIAALDHAKAEFQHARFHDNPARNTALVLVAPKARSFAVIGDAALHQRVGEPFWNDLIKEMTPYFARGATVDGIDHAITQLGRALAEHFPKRDTL